MRSHISWRGEQNIRCGNLSPLPSITVLKPRGKAEKGPYLLAVDLGCYMDHVLNWNLIVK